MDHTNSASDYNNNSDLNSSLGSDVLGSQNEVPATNIPVPSTNQLSSQVDSFK